MPNSDHERATNLKDACRAFGVKGMELETTINVYIYDPNKLDLESDTNGLHKVIQIASQRVDIDAIFLDSKLLFDIAKASGGYVRHLMQMMQATCIHALSRRQSHIQLENVTYAVNQYQFQFERSIPCAAYPELVHIARHKVFTDVQAGHELLLSRSVLEYTNSNDGHRWVYPHPVIKRIRTFNHLLNGEEPHV